MSAAAGQFILPNFQLQCGKVLSEAKLVYQTYGELSPKRDNVILYPTSYGGQHSDLDWLIHPEGILDPQQWFIIIPNQFGNGLSSSPSNHQECQLRESGFWFTHWDNIRAKKELLREVFKIEKLAMVYGWSMGAQQAYHWGALYPEQVERIVAICGTARTTEHNQVFLESLRYALTADSCWQGDHFEGTPERGYRAFARIYASWAASQAYYREGLHYKQGFASLEDYLLRGWEPNYRRHNPHDLLSMLETWRRCDISNNPIYQGDSDRALQSITAKTLVMPADTDLYFTPEDCEAEAKQIPNAKYHPIPSIWGHRAGNPHQNPTDEALIKKAVREQLEQ